ncbi:MAG: glycosyltransferase [Bryobacteraceae bacterium]
MTDHSIDFTVIVPTRDRHEQLMVCLQALVDLRYPRNKFEVVVVNDGSAEPVEPVVTPFQTLLPLTLLNQNGAGPAAARNHAAALARGRFLAFTDDDCAPAPDWLNELAVELAGAPDAIVGGRTVNAVNGNLFADASEMLVSYLYEHFNHDSGKPWFLASCNFALAAATFRAVGGFDASYPTAAAEDRDICDRLRLHGCNMIFVPEAVIYHRHALTLSSFWSQHFEYGRGARRYWRARERRSGDRVRIEPPGFYLRMLTYPLRHDRSRATLLAPTLLLLSQSANLAGFLCEWVIEKSD